MRATSQSMATARLVRRQPTAFIVFAKALLAPPPLSLTAERSPSPSLRDGAVHAGPLPTHCGHLGGGYLEAVRKTNFELLDAGTRRGCAVALLVAAPVGLFLLLLHSLGDGDTHPTLWRDDILPTVILAAIVFLTVRWVSNRREGR